jgi:L-fucose dehydrogenase
VAKQKMNLGLKEKVIIVSGGARGIGEGISNVLATEGAYVAIVDRNESESQKTIEKIQATGGQAWAFVGELTQPDECKKMVEAVVKMFGRIDGLVNNAGINDGVGLENGSYEKFIQSLHNNLIHYYLLAHHALPFLKESKGSIVNISSKTAETGQGGTSAYAAANGGRNALTRESIV